MQSLSFSQLKSFAEFLSMNLIGAQLQDVWTNGEIVFLELYLNREYILAIDSKPQLPMICLLDSVPKLKKQIKPVALFLNSHAVNLRLLEVTINQEWGRVIQLEFASNQKNCLLDVQLIPRAFNILIDSTDSEGGSKKISWAKPKDLPISTTTAKHDDVVEQDWLAFGKLWLQQRLTVSAGKKKMDEDQPSVQSEIQKKQKVLENLKKNLSNQDHNALAQKYRNLGEQLKFTEYQNLSDELKAIFDTSLSLAENRDKAFVQAKHIESKQEKIIERITSLEREIERIQNGPAVNKRMSDKKGLLENAAAKGRKLKISDQFEAVIGKSGQDNLAILRKSQPWDLWLHLKDYPGAHAIISRPRNKEVPLPVIEQVAKWVIKESFSNKKVDLGQSYEVLVVETRFVRPIKGDKLGRVTFQNSKVYSFSS